MLFEFKRREAPKEDVDLPVVGPFCFGNDEPTLKEILSDPMIHQVAGSDKMTPDDLKYCIEEMRKKISSKDKSAH